MRISPWSLATCTLFSLNLKPLRLKQKKEIAKEQKNRVATSYEQYSEMAATVQTLGYFLNSSDSCLQVIPTISGKS